MVEGIPIIIKLFLDDKYHLRFTEFINKRQVHHSYAHESWKLLPSFIPEKQKNLICSLIKNRNNYISYIKHHVEYLEMLFGLPITPKQYSIEYHPYAINKSKS